ncbi:N-acetylmuramoyl-L-alanine amidase [uncultured Intestinimonas sp.]|uniref:N-acetylmuramoyl-L-alanine amidase family protein n=1 Tax=uncultured Intestinimonas sp. TaxID=1689265 RepID=UPI0025CFE052|nr:N-acetylmuramoyl-L-alanine amidase [uncultured Intestinimonas sp.]
MRAERVIPLQDVERVRIYINEGQLPLRDVVAQQAPDIAITGVYYTSAWRPTCHLKAGGKVLADDPSYQPPGLAWDRGPDIHQATVPDHLALNYLSCCLLTASGAPEPKLYYNADVGGARGRAAVWLRGQELGVYACTDGADALTPEALQARLEEAYAPDTAIMLDGGSKVNYYDRASGTLIQGNDPSQNLILIYLKKKEGTPVDKFTVCLDPGHGPETVNASPDGTYRESEFAWDMYGRISALLEERGVNTVCTRTEDTKPSLTERCAVSNSAGADCFVSIHTNAEGVSGWGTAKGLEVYTSSGPDSAKRNVLARDILDRLEAEGVTLRSGPLKHSMELTVLVKTNAPAVLIEYGFHTTQSDVTLLKDASYRDKLARATARGVCDFLGVERPEADEPDEWASEEWEAAKKAGIMDGTRPHDPLTRQEAAVILERLGLLD